MIEAERGARRGARRDETFLKCHEETRNTRRAIARRAARWFANERRFVGAPDTLRDAAPSARLPPRAPRGVCRSRPRRAAAGAGEGNAIFFIFDGPLLPRRGATGERRGRSRTPREVEARGATSARRSTRRDGARTRSRSPGWARSRREIFKSRHPQTGTVVTRGGCDRERDSRSSRTRRGGGGRARRRAGEARTSSSCVRRWFFRVLVVIIYHHWRLCVRVAGPISGAADVPARGEGFRTPGRRSRTCPWRPCAGAGRSGCWAARRRRRW